MSEGSLFGELDLSMAASDPFAIPDNSYVCFLTDMRVGPTKAGDKVGMTLIYTVDEGAHEGKQISEWKMIPQPADPKSPSAEELRSMSFLKQRLLDLGVPSERINEVKPDDLIGSKVIVAVKNKNGYTNVTKLTKVDENFSSDNVTFS